MSFITAQQAKLDLELVPKEKRLENGKCNGRLNPGKIQREPTFQVVLDALALTPCYSAFFITADVPEVYMHQFWDFVYKHDTFYRFKMDKRKRFKLNLEILKDIFKICPRVQGQDFDALPTDEEIVSFLRELVHTGEINSLIDVIVNHMHQPCRTFVALINKSLSRKTTGLNKLCLSRAQILWVSTEEPTRKSKRVKRPAKKSTETPARGVVIRETPEMSLTKKKEKDSKHETDESKLGSKFDHEENKEDEDDEEEVKDEFVKTPSKDSDDEYKTKITDKAEGDEDEEMDYTTSQLYDHMDIRLNEPVDNDKGFVQEEDIPHTHAEIVSPMDVHVHHEVPSQQTPILLTVHVSVISDSSPVFSTIIPQSLPSFTPPPQQSTSTPPTTTKATNPQSTHPNFASVFQFNNRVTTLEKEVAELEKDPLHTQVIALVDDHLDARLGATRDEFMNYLSASITTRITEQVKNQLPQILPEEVSNLPSVIQKMVKESLEDVVLAKESSQLQSLYEAAAMLTKFELKKILIDKIDKSESYLAAPKHRECYEGFIKSYKLDTIIFSTYGKVYSLKRSQKDKDKDEDPFAGSDRRLKKRKTSKDEEPAKGPKAKESRFGLSIGDKSQSKSSGKFVQSEEPEFVVADSNMPQDQEENPSIEDVVLNIWSPVKVTYDKHALWEISNWREQRKTIYGYARGMQSKHDAYSTKRIMAMTRVEIMRNHRYGYLRENEVQRADNDLYTFKEGDFPRLRINDIEDILILIVQNRLTNLSGDDVSDFTIALRMLIRSNELYKFSDGTLTRLQTSLDDITKNIHMEYLPEEKMEYIGKKQANIMIKAIDKQLKESRMMRSLKKFVGERDYRTNIQLLQQTI
uniref:Uncharacterized protein n=1 Tax=Tanacetum cinerariifolium TaxID=118510 RepID=A0A6L2KFT1_TANCI|nr:hypothetical protein [Tanacetum cinerariifolium]